MYQIERQYDYDPIKGNQNQNQALVDHLETEVKKFAKQGLSFCKKHSEVLKSNMICTVALNILTAYGATFTAGASLAIPLTLGIVSLGLLIYHVIVVWKRYSDQQLASDLKPIFELISQRNYIQADSKLTAKLKLEDYQEEKNKNREKNNTKGFAILCNKMTRQLVKDFELNKLDYKTVQELAMHVRVLSVISFILRKDACSLIDNALDYYLEGNQYKDQLRTKMINLLKVVNTQKLTLKLKSN